MNRIIVICLIAMMLFGCAIRYAGLAKSYEECEELCNNYCHNDNAKDAFFEDTMQPSLSQCHNDTCKCKCIYCGIADR